MSGNSRHLFHIWRIYPWRPDQALSDQVMVIVGGIERDWTCHTHGAPLPAAPGWCLPPQSRRARRSRGWRSVTRAGGQRARPRHCGGRRCPASADPCARSLRTGRLPGSTTPRGHVRPPRGRQQEEHRRVFDVGYFGLCRRPASSRPNTSRPKVARSSTIGSVLSNRAIPLQGPYCAMKASVMQFTDALRMELEAEGAPISVTLIKPAAISTPCIPSCPQQAREARPPASTALTMPNWLPSDCFAAQKKRAARCRRRRLVWALTHLAPSLPRLADKGMELVGGESDADHRTSRRARHPRQPLRNAPRRRVEGNQEPLKRKTSLFLEAQMHPLATAACSARSPRALVHCGPRKKIATSGTAEGPADQGCWNELKQERRPGAGRTSGDRALIAD